MRAWEFRRMAAAFFLPNRCPFCDELIGVREFWCETCYEHLQFLDDPGEIPTGVDGFTAVCAYNTRARSAVLRLKKGNYRYPADAFAVLIAENAAELIQQADIITGVPSSRERRKQLGYAQSELIAGMVAEIARKPFRRLLGAVPGKKEQKHLTAEEQLENARNSFRLAENAEIKGKKILMIDDVCTTGATFSVCAELLRGAGAINVSAASFARTLKR